MSQLLNHLHVIFNTFLNSLGLNGVANLIKVIYLFGQVVLYFTYGDFRLLFEVTKRLAG